MRKIAVPDEGAESLFGTYDENLKHLESAFNVRIRTSGSELIVEGDPLDVPRAEKVLDQLSTLIRGGYRLAKGDVRTAAQLVAQDENVELADYFLRSSTKTSGKRQVVPKSVTQKKYLDAIDQHDIVFGIGPAGTGKTYLAMAQAVSFLLAKRAGGRAASVPAGAPGVVVPAPKAGQPDHPGTAGGRSRREAGISARRSAGESEPVLAPALRRAVRHDRARSRRAAARARHDRGRADRLHARPDAERRVRHSRRGAEHHVGADEDVPDAARLRLEGGHHRGRHADRFADGPHVGARGG